LLTFLGAILVVGLGILFIRGFSQEDNWICQQGVWVKHGNPTGRVKVKRICTTLG